VTSIQRVGIVGAGAMGQGIAHVCAQAGYDVLFYDVDLQIVEKGIRQIAGQADAAIAKGKSTPEEKSALLARIHPVRFDALTADLIIEAVVEKLDVKRKIFADLESINPDTTVLASNTSSLSITQIAAPLRARNRFLGLHFFNPAHLMKLVEVIAGPDTDAQLVQTMVDFVKTLGKIPVMVKDSPGFIVNRVARLYYLESLRLVEEGVAEMSAIDALLRSAGFRLGPFELMDLIGNDVNLEVSRLMYEAFDHAPRFKPSAIQEDKVRMGELGRKTGKGYYDYEKK